MEINAEILESVDNWEKELAATAEVRRAQIPVQTVIINGEEQVIYDDTFALVCPRCNTILQSFQPGLPLVEILKALNAKDEESLNKTLYCKKCGQKIRILRPAPVEADYVVQETVE